MRVENQPAVLFQILLAFCHGPWGSCVFPVLGSLQRPWPSPTGFLVSPVPRSTAMPSGPGLPFSPPCFSLEMAQRFLIPEFTGLKPFLATLAQEWDAPLSSLFPLFSASKSFSGLQTQDFLLPSLFPSPNANQTYKYMPGRIAESKKLFSVLAKKRPRSTSTFAPFRRQTTIVNKDEIQSHLYTSVFCTCSRTDIMVLPSLPKNVRGKCAEVAAKLGAGKVKWHVLLFTGNNGKRKDFPLWQTDGIGMERKKREKR